MAQVFGPRAIEGYFEYMDQYTRSNPPPASIEEAEDLFLEALSAGAQHNLSCLADQLRWHVSAGARARMARFPVPAACEDVDGDGYSPFLGDCDDGNSAVHPGAPEIANGVDDNCNGLVDESQVTGNPGFSQDWGHPTPTTFPFSASAASSSSVWTHLGFNAPKGGRIRLRTCSRSQWTGFVGFEDGKHGSVGSVWAELPGYCRMTFFNIGDQDNQFLRILNWQPGSYEIDAGSSRQTRYPYPPWGVVGAVPGDDGAWVLSVRTTSLSHTAGTPTWVRFWVSKHGWVGTVPFGEVAELRWSPPKPLVDGEVLGVRAQLFDGPSPVSEPSLPAWFTYVSRVAGEAETALVIPTAGRIRGAGGTVWRTDLFLTNPSSRPALASLFFLPTGDEGVGARVYPVVVGPGKAEKIADAVSSLFGRDDVSGAIVVRGSKELVIGSRTFNQAPAGTYGQFVPAIEFGRAIAEGETAVLPQLIRTGRFRTNLGFANLAAMAGSVLVKLRADTGVLLGEATYDLSAYGHQQINDVFRTLGLDSVAAGYAEVSVAGSAGRVIPYASVVDNVSGDPILVLPVVASAGPLVIPTAGHVPGAAGTNWRTDIEVFNPGPTTAEYAVDFLQAEADGSTYPTRRYRLDPGKLARYVDVVRSMFGLTKTGALRVRPISGKVAVDSRTYNQLADRTYGQRVPAFSGDEAIVAGQEAALTHLGESARTDSGFRTNIGLVNLSSSEVTVDITFYRGNGEELGALALKVAPYSQRQVNRVLTTVTSSSVESGFARLRSTSSGAAFHAYASVIDNRSVDPIFVPAARTGDAPIAFSDPSFESCLRSQLFIPVPSPIMPSDVEFLRFLEPEKRS